MEGTEARAGVVAAARVSPPAGSMMRTGAVVGDAAAGDEVESPGGCWS